MATYTVECRGECRELFAVEADSEEEAMEKWSTGTSFLIEVMGSEPFSAELDE